MPAVSDAQYKGTSHMCIRQPNNVLLVLYFAVDVNTNFDVTHSNMQPRICLIYDMEFGNQYFRKFTYKSFPGLHYDGMNM